MKGHVGRRGKTWGYVLDIGRDESGRRQQRTKGGFRTRKECEAALTETLQRKATGDLVNPSRETLAMFLTRWLDSAAGIRASTREGYRLLIKSYINPRIGGTPLQRLKPSQLNTLYTDLLEHGRCNGKGGLSARTVRYCHATLHRALGEALRWGDVTRNVADAASPPKQRRNGSLRTWSADELGQFLRHIEGDFYAAPLLLLATTGARRGEALGARWCDLDFKAGRLSVNQTLISVKGQILYSTPKTDRGARSISLDANTLAVLKAHRQRVLEDRMILGLGAPDAESLVFTAPDGGPVNPESFSDHFQRLAKTAGLPTIRLHDLRHGWATMALQAGLNPRVVSDRLGHSTVAFTLDVYSSVTPGLQEDAAQRVAALVFAHER